ncbi:MAG: A/G-specific adenine glycosylase [Winogradskyella sp.]|nr:A/G-specific adenine glycosylase [Winogradskyella sp.]
MDFKNKLKRWYSINKRNLPWRVTTDPYRIWLSEIILQQTQVKQGLPYYKSFVKTYPTVFDLANANEEDVLKLWQGLGYYSRARNLHATAKYVASELNGKFPDNYKDLLQLKGVGDYTASAIASFAFNKATAVVDGNVYRVLSRVFGIETPINSSAGIKEFKAIAQSLIDTKDPATYNQAIMEFGSVQCKPKTPDCPSCPFNTICIALQKGQQHLLPVKINKTKVKTKYFNYLVFRDAKGQTLFEKRTQKGIWKNLYQFPLVETEKSLNISDFEQLDLEPYLKDILPFDITLYNAIDKIHKLSHQHLHTKFWIIDTPELPKKAVSIKTIRKYPTSVLINDFINEFKFGL